MTALVRESFGGPRAFARWALREGRLELQPLAGALRFDGRALQAVLYRNGPWQVELIALLPGVVVPRHRHRRVRACEVVLAGGGTVAAAGPLGERANRAWRGGLLHRLAMVPEGLWHAGAAGPTGTLALSFQLWLTGEPGHVGEDWEGGE